MENLLGNKLDHSPIVPWAKLCSNIWRKGCGFRFETYWLLDVKCEVEVKVAWEGSIGDEITRHLFLVGHKLAACMEFYTL